VKPDDPQTMAADGYLSSCRAITMRWMWPVPPQIRVTAKTAASFPRVDDTAAAPARRQHIQHWDPDWTAAKQDLDAAPRAGKIPAA